MERYRSTFTRNQTTNAFTCASTFYGLEALKVAVQFNKKFDSFLKSNRMLLEDINTYQKSIVAKLAPMLYDYSALACYGELRHCAATSHARYKGAGFPQRTCGGRNEAYNKALNYAPHDILTLSVEAFDPVNKWDGSYGGAKWQMIAKHALRYGKIDDLIFCDTAFSLSHNCSPFLNKSESRIFAIQSSDRYKELLDTKFNEDVNTTISYIISNAYELDRPFVHLIERCCNLGFLKLGSYAKKNLYLKKKIYLLDTIDRNYEPLEWSQKKMTAKKMYKWCSTIKEQKFYEQLRVGMNCKMVDSMVVCYQPHSKNIKKNKTLFNELFPYGSGNHSVNTLAEKIGFPNSFESMVIEKMDGGDLVISVSNGDKIYTSFRTIIGLSDKFKPIKLK